MRNHFQDGKLSAFVIFFLLFNLDFFAQISAGGNPISFMMKGLSNVQTVTMYKFDVNKLLLEDSLDALSKEIPFRFGKSFNVNLNLENSGVWDELPSGDRIWRLRISSPGAYSINLIYNDYWLPEGAKLYLYNDDRSHIIGAFTNANNKETGKFATRPVIGDAVILEYFEPANVNYQGHINVSSVIHAYKDIFNILKQKDFGSSGSCNNNVNCPEGADWQNEKRAVAMVLLAGGTRWCSGALVNNVNVDLKQYFLTADHCLGASDTWIFMFNYESPTCDNVDGPTNFTVQGSTLLANNEDSDFALVEITEPIPTSYEVHWAGWSNIDVPSTHSTGIHHPAGDVKKISFDYDPSISSKYLDNQGITDSHWKIEQWDDGTTEGGSSGSPLFDQNHRIIGQLHGGWASCTSLTADYYGKFAMSWDRGETPETRLKDWLDPNDTGVQTLDGWDPTIGDPDDVPPTAITDLAVTNLMSDKLTLTWTAPLDTSYNGVIQYYIKMSESPINDANFDAAVSIPYSETPKDAGEAEALTIDNLNFSTTYYFAIKSSDFWENVSDISNVSTGVTLGQPVAEVTPAFLDLGDVVTENSWTEQVVIANVSDGASTLNYSASLENSTFPSGAVRIGSKSIKNKDVQNVEVQKGVAPKIKGQTMRGAGGPDAFGYCWKDSDEANGPVYQWDDISETGTILFFADGMDDGYSDALDLGFNFNFYGIDYSTVYVSTNGFISFGLLTNSYYTNSEIPNSVFPNKIIAPFWDDLDGSSNGNVYYKAEADRFIIQFTQFQKWDSGSSSGNYTFQIILNKNGSILIHYNDMTGTLDEATVGIENETGTDGLQVTYNAVYPPSNEFSVLFYSPITWVESNDLDGGTIFNGNSANVMLNFNTSGLDLGSYAIDLIFSTTDPENPTIVVPISMVVDSISVGIDYSTDEELPTEFALEQNYPNPFTKGSGGHMSTKIKYALPTESAVRLSVYNIIGEEVARLVNGLAQAGYHEISWNASQLPSGLYIYRIEAVSSDGSKNYFDQKKMLLIK
jgi:hypothetical protein